MGNFPAPVSYQFEYEPIIDTRERVAGNLNIKKADDSEMIKLVFTHQSPLMATKILSDITKIFIQKKTEWEENDAESKKNYINNVLA